MNKSVGNQKLYKLEALRGLAAFYVVLHHTFPHNFSVGGFNAYNFFRFGQEAVILFFLLSGFVIKYSYAKSSNSSFRQYFLKRFLRIYIPLVCVFFITYLVFSYNANALIDPKLRELLGNFFMLQDWSKVKPHVIVDPYLANNPLWSLSYEWWFYMLFFPITAFVSSSSSQDRLIFSFCIAVAMLYTLYPVFPLRVLMYFAIWWTGVVMAERYMELGRFGFRDLILPLFTLSLIIFILIVSVFVAKSNGQRVLLGMHPVLEARHFLFALVSVICAVLWRNANWVLFDKLIKPFAFVAPVSYTIYIIHWPIMVEGTFFQWIRNPVLQWMGYFIVTLLLSYLIELIIYPFLRQLLTSHFEKRRVSPV